jgi:hypothetical protein
MADFFPDLHVERQEKGSRFILRVVLGEQDALIDRFTLFLEVVVIVP